MDAQKSCPNLRDKRLFAAGILSATLSFSPIIIRHPKSFIAPPTSSATTPTSRSWQVQAIQLPSGPKWLRGSGVACLQSLDSNAATHIAHDWQFQQFAYKKLLIALRVGHHDFKQIVRLARD
jgi:hypothetical protein